MPGLVGVIGKEIKSRTGSTLIDKMAESIKYIPSDHVDKWEDEYLSIARVHHGIINPETQPIYNEDKSLFIFMDGEVFDYQAEKEFLIGKGHVFRYTDNDAEFCLHLYEEYSFDAFEKLNGSFLIAISDINRHDLLLVNDRFSSRPLFYYQDGKDLIFGSQLRSILEYDDLPRDLDKEAVLQFFVFQRVLGNRTYYKDIKTLMPATVLQIKNNNISFRHYWQMGYKIENHSNQYYIDRLAKAIKNAVDRRTQDNLKYGILLSSGLDARVVLAASDKKMKAYTFGDFENATEVKLAKRIAKAKNCEHVFLKRNFDYYPDLVEEAVDITDGMFDFTHSHWLGFLNQIRQEVDILFTGFELGRLFRGAVLPFRQLHLMKFNISTPFLDKIELNDLSEAILDKHKYVFRDFGAISKLFKNLSEKRCYSLMKNSIDKILKETFMTHGDTYEYENSNLFSEQSLDKDNNPHNAWDYFNLHSGFSRFVISPNLLCIPPYIDERTIMYDNELFDVYLSMPPHLRANAKIYRKIFRKIAPKVLSIPDANTYLPLNAPWLLHWIGSLIKGKILQLRILLNHNQSRFGTYINLAELIRKNKKLRNMIKGTIEDDKSIDPNIFNKKQINNIFNDHMQRKQNNSLIILRILTFGQWNKKYGPQSGKP